MFSYSLTASGLLSCLYFSTPSFAAFQDEGPFPPVDLGYAVHVPTMVSNLSSGLQYADYNNIRFAQPPLGDLRFRKPEVPPPTQSGIQNGSAEFWETSCVSSIPPHLPFPNNGTAWGQEDCLYLNVRVPEGVKEGDNVPVLHWLHGSAYSVGSKESSGDALGVYEDIYGEDQKFIYVASNYRLGLFGWIVSPDEDMDANVGLHDGVAALEWTKEHISKFGGDPDRITAIGESAGATLINLMLVSNGGEGTLPFNQAFLSSAGMTPNKNPARAREVYDETLKATDCDSIDCLRNLPEKDLFEANKYLINDLSPAGVGGEQLGPGVGFCPVVDGEYIEDHPYILYKEGRFHKEIEQVIVGNLVNEGMGVPAGDATPEEMPEKFPELVRSLAPKADDATVDLIRSLYDYPPENPEKLRWDFITDGIFACHAYNAAKAYESSAKRYSMSIPPAIHGLDLNYYFFYNQEFTPVESIPIAKEFQERLRRYITGAENLEKFPDLEDWPSYGLEQTTFDVTLDGYEVIRDPWEVNGRCEVLNEIFADPKNGA
ncbi:hypothetical protein FQN54_007514 [Arachnomyces sp. PD_36]|nr:hypothetical protein FQN54_007514 [Arachnomyces sp. PD_36]